MAVNLQMVKDYKISHNVKSNRDMSYMIGVGAHYVADLLSGRIKSMTQVQVEKFIAFFGSEFCTYESKRNRRNHFKRIPVYDKERIIKVDLKKAKGKNNLPTSGKGLSANCEAMLKMHKVPFTLSKSGLVFIIRGKRNIDFKYQSSVIVDRVSKKSCLGNVKKVIEMYNKKEGK